MTAGEFRQRCAEVTGQPRGALVGVEVPAFFASCGNDPVRYTAESAEVEVVVTRLLERRGG